MANCSALHGTTLSAVTAFPRHSPSTPSSRKTLAHVALKPRGFDIGFDIGFDVDPRAPGRRSCMIVRARSSGATAVRAATPASPPAKSCFAGCARGGVCSAERRGPVAAASQFHAALSRSCALGSSAAYFLNSAYPTVRGAEDEVSFRPATFRSGRRSSSAIMALASSALADAMPSARTAASVSDAARRRVDATGFGPARSRVSLPSPSLPSPSGSSSRKFAKSACLQMASQAAWYSRSRRRSRRANASKSNASKSNPSEREVRASPSLRASRPAPPRGPASERTSSST